MDDLTNKVASTHNQKLANEQKKEVLWENEWLEVQMIDDWYTSTHNAKGDGVAVLGLRKGEDDSMTEVLVRMEHTPCHGEGLRPTSLTGTIEHGLNAIETAVKELKEESGYDAKPEEFTELGWVYPSKFSDYKQYLYAVDLTGKEQGDIEGDGTIGEKDAHVEWKTAEEALEANTPVIGCILCKLAQKTL